MKANTNLFDSRVIDGVKISIKNLTSGDLFDFIKNEPRPLSQIIMRAATIDDNIIPLKAIENIDISVFNYIIECINLQSTKLHEL
jgi:hypothetical protein